MKLSVIIFVFIILLAIIGIVIIKLKFDLTDNVKWTDIIQVFLTFALVLVTGWNVYLVKQTVEEMAKSRIAQEESSRESIRLSQEQIQKAAGSSLRIIEEMKLAREQQLRPYIDVHFHWDNNLSKFFSIARNLGGGIATDIEYSYPFDQSVQNHQYKALGPGEEVINMTPFSSDHINQKDSVKVAVSYKDAFGNVIKEEYDQNLRELANHPLPSKFSERRREQLSRQEDYIEKISMTLNYLLSEIKKLNGILENKK